MLYSGIDLHKRTVAIHPTPTIGMGGVLADISKRATQGFKREAGTRAGCADFSAQKADWRSVAVREFGPRWSG